jgi:hypothetical protein
MHTLLRIHFGIEKNFYLDFELLDSPITTLWLDRMECRNQWPMDDPERFYGFNTQHEEINRALIDINECIEIINNYQLIITRTLTSVDDQDTLNYLHNVFEKYHGMLDQQTHSWWVAAPEEVRSALARLNIAVHRCEAASRMSQPRFVCTWWGMPKTKTIPTDMFEKHGKLNTDFGGVYLNYVEIGKTLLELATDNDQYIADEMFKPFDYYSADFVVHFYKSTQQEIDKQEQLVNNYFNKHRDFFSSHNIQSCNDYRTRQWKLKVAQLLPANCNNNTVLKIKNNQYVHTVEIL